MKDFFKRLVVKTLTFEAQVLLERKRPKIIAITGSVGKTSIKDAIYTVIKKEYSTRKSEKSFNSEVGVVLTVLGLPNAWNNPVLWLKNIIDGFFIAFFSKTYPEYLVLETGIDRPNDMSKIIRYIKPDIVVLTSLPNVPVHVEYFDSPQAVINEKMKLIESLKPEGVLVYNNDDQIIQKEVQSIRHKSIGFSRYINSQFKVDSDKIFYNDDKPKGIDFTLKHIDKVYNVRVSGVVGSQHVYTYAGAIAVAVQCGISIEEAVEALSEHILPPGRMRIIEGIKGSTIIDDTYNSSPIAVEQALLTIKEIKYSKRKIVILGDMLELGRYSVREHEIVGELTANVADVLITVGVRARKIAESALKSGLNEKSILQYDDVYKAGKELQNLIRPGDLILVKASQGIRAEKIVEEIMQEPNDSINLLARQDDEWQKR